MVVQDDRRFIINLKRYGKIKSTVRRKTLGVIESSRRIDQRD